MEKRTWVQIAISIHNYHIGKLKNDENWRIEDTARSLNRAKGAVCQYLKIASWLITSENQLKKCDTMNEALELIRKKEREMKLRSIQN